MSRLLVDENLPPSLAAILRQAGHDALHVNQVGLSQTPDHVIMARARQEGWTVVTLDRDYPHMLRDGVAEGPSVIRISQRGGRAITGATRQAEALQAALPKLDAYLMGGASVTLDARGVRVDPLPLGRAGRALDSATADRAPAASASRDQREPGGAGREASGSGREASGSGREASGSGREPARSGSQPPRAGREAADQQRERAEGIGRQRERRAHPSSPQLGR